MTTIAPSVQQVLDWHEQHLGALVYDESSSTRLSYATLADLLTPTDCSGDAIRTYRHFTGINLTATYTGNLWNQGTLITTSLADAAAHRGMLPGDLVLYHWKGWAVTSWDPFNHVNIYGGNDIVYNHGGPNQGPIKESLAMNVGNAQAVRVIRLIAPIPTPIPPTPLPEEDMLVQFKDDTATLARQQAVYWFSGGYLIHLNSMAVIKTLGGVGAIKQFSIHDNIYKCPIAPGQTDDPRKIA